MKLLHHLDKLILSTKQMLLNANPQLLIKLLPRDTYICEWTEKQSPYTQKGLEYIPVSIKGAGRPTSSGDLLHVGILHIPYREKNSTLTLLPPNPQILLPLLISAVEMEHRVIKKYVDKGKDISGISNVMRGVVLDEVWHKNFRNYLYRTPPYYLISLRRALKPILPTSVHSLLSFGNVGGSGNTTNVKDIPDANLTMDNIASMCFSRNCFNKIRQGELFAKQENERLELQEREIRRRGSGVNPFAVVDQDVGSYEMGGYGQYDPRCSVSSYLSALRSMPPPWRVHGVSCELKLKKNRQVADGKDDLKKVPKEVISVTET